ncbi:MAG: hypothetical protein GHHEDOFH_00863 [Pseudorhodoplanes sp.]|nr:hypothetical protein [Pseudorhodoplanes sp.]
MSSCLAGCVVLGTIALVVPPALAQETGPLETFGSNGRLYSGGGDEFYLLSRRSYASEDSRGYEGQIRIVRKYPGGGYEEQIMDYTARCFAPFDNMIYVIVREPGKESYDDKDSTEIKSPNQFPGATEKSAYNLYWAACHSQFGKFKDTATESPSASVKKASYWKHNDSIVYLTADGVNRRFFYENPREGLRAIGVTPGTLLFEGKKEGYAYSGTAYIFSRTCGATAYPVTGNVSADEKTVTMYGQAPQINSSCEIASYRNDVLAFHFQRRAQD